MKCSQIRSAYGLTAVCRLTRAEGRVFGDAIKDAARAYAREHGANRLITYASEADGGRCLFTELCPAE